jgi:TPR repeat protein
MYLYGQGVPRDYDEARRLYEQGAALGNDAAINGLGVLYDQGHGVAHDSRKARQLFEKAAALGNPEAKKNLRVMRK